MFVINTKMNRFGASIERSRAFYRIGATRALSGRKRAKPPLSGNILIKEVTIKSQWCSSSNTDRLITYGPTTEM